MNFNAFWKVGLLEKELQNGIFAKFLNALIEIDDFFGEKNIFHEKFLFYYILKIHTSNCAKNHILTFKTKL